MTNLIPERQHTGIEFSPSLASFMGSLVRLIGLKLLPLARPRHVVAGAQPPTGQFTE
jgi:hypothetical protein